MENHYSVDWNKNKKHDQLSGYYSEKNIRIYKPHGSINWGRAVYQNDRAFRYHSIEDLYREFLSLELHEGFDYVRPAYFYDDNITFKNLIPAIAIPFKEKNYF
jgi:hypothetical protein